MSLLCPEVFLLSLSLDDDKHFIFSLQDFLWNVEYDFATLDVNKTCLKCIFYSSLLVLRRQKYGATVSVSLHILRLGHRWSEYWRNQSVKCSVGEHLGFLWFRNQRYLWIYFFFILFLASEQVSVSVDGIVMAEERQGCNWKGHTQGVRGDTEKSISLHFHSIHMPNSVFRLTGFKCVQHAFWAGGKKGRRTSSPFPLIILDSLIFFLHKQKGFILGTSSFCWQFLMKTSFAFILLHLSKDRMHSSLSVAQSSDEAETGVWRVQDGWVLLAKYCLWVLQSNRGENKSCEWMGHRTCF